MTAFQRFENEAAIIGRLLTSYATLEIDLLYCACVARDDLDAALKAMFGARGNSKRVETARRRGRALYQQHNLNADFAKAIGAMKFCLDIRNAYAHCNWYDDNTGRLAFVNLEELAGQRAVVRDLASLTVHHIDVPTLQAQQAYFHYTDRLLNWLNYEGRVLVGKLAKNPLAKPAPMTRPPLHCP